MRYLTGLREARERALMTQRELAERADITPSTVNRLETGVQAGRISTIRKITAALGVSADELIDWERPTARTQPEGS
jgi:transcriptional regulator with XRE-family HTH domain